MTLTVRVRYDGRALIPEEPLNLPTAQMLEIEIRLPDTPTRRGSSSKPRLCAG